MKPSPLSLTLACLLLSALAGHAADQTWSGGSLIDANWSTPANWAGGAAPGDTSGGNTNLDTATFNAAIANGWGALATPVVIDSANQNIKDLIFTGSAGSFFIGAAGGNALRLTNGGGILVSSALTSADVRQTINAPLALQGVLHGFTNDSAQGRGTLFIGGSITSPFVSNADVSLLLAGSNTSSNTVTGSIADGGGSVAVTKSGAGTWVLIGANSYTGATTVNAGVLRIQSTNALGSTAGGTSVAFGASLHLQGGITTAAEALTLTGAGLSAGGALRNLSGDNTYAGLVTLGGDSRINSDVGLLTLSHPGTISGNFTLTVGGAGNTTIQSVVGTGTGGLTKDGIGTLTLTRQNTYTGATAVNGGTLLLDLGGGNNVISVSSSLTLGGGTLQIRNAGAQTFNGLSTTADTGSRILPGGGQTLTLGALTSAGVRSALNFNTAAGGADAGTGTVGTSVVVLSEQTAGSVINAGFTVTDAGGFGLATVNGSDQVVRLTTAPLLATSGASSLTHYRIDNNAGGPAAAGSSTLAITASQTAGSITVDTTAAAGAATLDSGVVLGADTWNFGGSFGGGVNPWQISGGTGGAGLRTTTANVSLQINNNAAAPITFATPILANGSSGISLKGTGTTVLAAANTYIGLTAVHRGTLEVVPGGSITSQSLLNVGFEIGDLATLNITGGSVSNTSATLGANRASSGTANVSSGTWTSSGSLDIGFSGTGVFNLSGTGAVGNFHASLGFGIGSRGAANVSGGTWTSSGTLTIGGGGTGLLNLSDAGAVTNTAATLGMDSVSTGAANVSGGTWTSSGSLTIGNSGIGVVILSGTGAISSTSVIVGRNTISSGTANVSGGTWTSSGGFTIGFGGTGVLNLSGTGAISSSFATLGSVAGSSGTVNVSGGTWTSSGNLLIGFAGNGVLNLSGTGGISSSSVIVGSGSSSNGTVNISGGTWTNSGGFTIGDNGSGTANVSGGTWTNSGVLAISNTGAGVLNLSGTGAISSTSVIIGQSFGNIGTANVSSGTWISGSTLTIGSLGDGVLNLSGTGAVSNTAATLGFQLGNTGTANVSGGTWTNSSGLIIGDTGIGVLNLTGGTVHAGGVGGTGTVTLGIAAAGSGTLNLGTGGTAGTLNAATVTGGSGTAVVNFNHNGALAFAPALTGSLSVTHEGSGATTLSGTMNTYSGGTTVSAGMLNVTNTSGSATGTGGVLVTGSGALGGTGTVSGAVTLSGGGGVQLSDGAVGTLTLGSTLNITGAAGANPFSFDLGAGGAGTDKIITGGATSITTPGAAVITLNQIGGAATPITPGTYTLIQAGGSMAGLGSWTLATTRAFGQVFSLGLNGNNLELTTASATPSPAAAFWQGGADVNWSSAGNWNTDVASNLPAGAAPGSQTNVTFATTTPMPANLATNLLDTDFDINSLNFNTSGVTIGGSGMLTLTAGTANGNTAGNGISTTNSSGTNTINVAVGLAASQTWTVAGGTLAVSGGITDFGGGRTLTKAGAGALTLSGANTYTGTTTISAGALNLSGAGSLADVSAVNMAGGTGVFDLSAISAGGETIGSLAGVAGSAVVLGSKTLTVGGDGSTTTFAGVISGTGGSLTKAGAGTLTLSGANTYTGATTINEGTLQLGNGGSTGGIAGTSAISVASGAVLRTNLDNDIVINQGVTGAGGVAVANTPSGRTFLQAASTYTGTTVVDSGALVVNGSISGTSGVTVAASSLLAGTGAITAAVNQSVVINGFLSVGDPGVAAVPSTLSVTTSGAGGIVMGTGSFILMDVFTGAGTGGMGISDTLDLTGVLNANAGGTLVIGNPNAMTGFVTGDQWKLLELNGGAGSVTGTLAVNAGALGLTADQAGSFDPATGILSIIAAPAPPPPATRQQMAARQTVATSGLPVAAAQGQALIQGGNLVTQDLSNHLFQLRVRGAEEVVGSIAASVDEGVIVGQGDGPEDAPARRVPLSRRWTVFTTANFGNVQLSPIGNQAGVQVDAWASAIGIERRLSRSLTVGIAASFMHSEQDYTGGAGSLKLEGPAVSTYLSCVRHHFWTDLLYSYGSYELESQRHPGAGFPTANGSTRTSTHAIQYNTGWNFRFQKNTLVTGPFVGIDYLHGTVNAYSENGGGLAALRFAEQSYESLVMRVGWSLSKRFETRWAGITPQLRVSYERQNIKNNNGTSVSLLNVPFSATAGNQSPGQDYLVAGLGVNFAFSDRFSLMLSYQGQFFRQDLQAHFGGLRLSYTF